MNALKLVDAKVASVTAELGKLEDLKQSRTAIQAKLEKLASDGRAALDGNMDEAAAVTALTNVQALRSVYGAKLDDSTAKIAAQEKTALATGLNARAFVQHCQQTLATHRLDRSIEFVSEYFVGNPSGDARHLATQSKRYVESVRLGNELGAYLEPEQEIGHGLKRLPANWIAVRDACEAEEGFILEFPESWVE